MANPKTLGATVGVSYEAGDAYAKHVERRISSADAAGELRDILVGAVEGHEGLWIAHTDELEVRARAHSETDADGDEFMLVTDVQIVQRTTT